MHIMRNLVFFICNKNILPCVYMILGEVVKGLRLRRGLTQEEVCRIADITQGFYSSIENGATPSLETLIKIAEVFQVPMLFIICLATSRADIPRNHRAWYNNYKKEWDNIIEEAITKT